MLDNNTDLNRDKKIIPLSKKTDSKKLIFQTQKYIYIGHTLIVKTPPGLLDTQEYFRGFVSMFLSIKTRFLKPMGATRLDFVFTNCKTLLNTFAIFQNPLLPGFDKPAQQQPYTIMKTRLTRK